MEANVRRSGFTLALSGLVGAFFFWLTDPRFGATRSAGYEVIDRVNEAHLGTAVGVAGSAVVLVVGLWLMTRRAA